LLILNGIVNDERGLTTLKIMGMGSKTMGYGVLFEKNIWKREDKGYVVDKNFAKSLKAFGEFVIPDFENKSKRAFDGGTIKELS
jgi:hypothetical protein